MLVVFGAINIDLVFPVPRLLQSGDMMHSGSGWTELGGRGANQAMAAVRDGSRVALAGVVGTDALADMALQALEDAGVDRRSIARHPGATGRSAICVTPDGHAHTVTDLGANCHARAGHVPDHLLGRSRTLLLQMDAAPAENARLIERARAHGTRIVLNLAPCGPIDTDALRAVDVLLAKSADLAWLGEHLGTGNNSASIQSALGVSTVRMLGVQGVEASWEGGYVRMPAVPVQMQDTTAAADCFAGVLAGALDRGAAVPEAMRRAAVAAALTVTKVGAGRTMPQRHEIEDALPGAPEVTQTQPEVSD